MPDEMTTLQRAISAATTAMLSDIADPYRIDHDETERAARIAVLAALPTLCEGIARDIGSKYMGECDSPVMAQRWAEGVARGYPDHFRSAERRDA